MKYLLPSLVLSLAMVVFAAHNGSARDEPQLKPETLLIVGEADQRDYNSRIRAVRALPRDVSQVDVERLIEFLEIHVVDDSLRIAELNAIKNDIVVMLSRQDRSLPQVGGHLIAGFRDEAMDVVWRDYCLQHLSHWYRRSNDVEQKEEILEVLWEATELRESTYAGTSLLSLRYLMRRSPDSVDLEKLGQRALAVVKNESMSVPSRISGMQVAETQVDALPVARALAQDSSENVLLRTSALGVLGRSLEEQDITILKEFSNSSDVRLRMAARAGLSRG